MPTINISETTFRRLASRARPFVDKDPEDVITWLLDQTEPNQGQTAAPVNGAGRDLTSHAGRVPHGSRLRARYKGKEYFASVSDGYVVWNGQSYTSLSRSAIAVIQSTGSKRATEDGWRFWEVQLPGDQKWIAASDLQK